jgi:hypothetical protein
LFLRNIYTFVAEMNAGTSTTMHQKTFLLIGLLAFLLSLGLVSCKTHERCPAYGMQVAPESKEARS